MGDRFAIDIEVSGAGKNGIRYITNLSDTVVGIEIIGEQLKTVIRCPVFLKEFQQAKAPSPIFK